MFVLLFVPIIVVAGFSLFKSGKITSNKMQLQNAADAAAYSMSMVEARDLNFAAYLNRAMVANEVAIGQMVGLASWAIHFRSFADYLSLYNNLMFSWLPPVYGLINGLVGFWRSGGQMAVTAMSQIANVMIGALTTANDWFGRAQVGYHAISMFSAVGVLDEVIKENGPPGTKVSDFGIVSLITHLYTYGALPTALQRPGQKFSFTKTYNTGRLPGYRQTKVKKTKFGEQTDGYARLAALIRDSRDPFTRERGRDPINPDKSGWELHPPPFPVTVDWHPSIGIGNKKTFYLGMGLDLYVYLDIYLNRKGGSELRLVMPSGRSATLTPGHYNWSSADTTGMTLDVEFNLGIWARACIVNKCFRPSVSGGLVRNRRGDKARIVGSALGRKIYFTPWFDLIRTAPFGSGFAEVGQDSPNNLNSLPHMRLKLIGGVVEPDHYGMAADNSLAWLSVPPAPMGIAAQATLADSSNRVNKTYSGLPDYYDTTDNDPLLDIGAPNLLIGLVQDEDDFDSTTTYAEPTGRFSLNEAFADEELAVIAKSQVYFARPTDRLASHFHRGDGLTEVGSTFNPYWQARLIETGYSERLLALLMQQKEDFINTGQSFNLFFGDLLDLFPSL